MDVYLVKYETDIGPVFSSKEKAAEWYRKADDGVWDYKISAFRPVTDADVEKFLTGNNDDFPFLVTITLDDENFGMDA